jgi:twitching motility protein PilT
MELDSLLRLMTDKGASDLHLKPTRPPLLRITGRLIPLEIDPLTPDDIREMVLPILNPQQKAKLDERLAVDVGYGVHGLARFRGNIYMQRGTYAATFRRIPMEIRDIETSSCPGCCSTSSTCRWAWCWSPAPPAAASRPRWRR